MKAAKSRNNRTPRKKARGGGRFHPPVSHYSRGCGGLGSVHGDSCHAAGFRNISSSGQDGSSPYQAWRTTWVALVRP